MRVCVVGAGSSGITAVKTLRERGLDVDAYEKGSGIGGNWRYGNDNGMSSAYASLHINTSKTLMQYSDFPMPASYPDYPDHRQILAYFEAYSDRFGVREHVRFKTEVRAIVPTASGAFDVTVRPEGGDERTIVYDAVVVANGHHWKARMPAFEGALAPGVEVIHAHDYRTPHRLVDKRVLVVGVGNSAVDIACEACRVATRTVLSTRRSAFVFPKYILGRPTDTLVDARLAKLPDRVLMGLVRALVYVTRGDQRRYGMPLPEHGIDQAHPTVSDELLHLVGHGRIAIKPDVAELRGDRVRFRDGTEEPFDVVVYATGYDIVFPFLAREVIDPSGNEIRLFRRVIHPAIPRLAFIGLIQPLGAVMPIAEKQSRWLAALFSGEAALPDRAAMEREIDEYRRTTQARYVASVRHTIQVDFHPYLGELETEIARGRERVESGRCTSSSRRPRLFSRTLSRTR